MTTESFFGFKCEPFARAISVESLFSPPSLLEMCSRLNYVAKNKRFGVVTGPSGVGKSTAIRKFVSSLDPSLYKAVYIADSALRPRVFYWEVLRQLSGEDSKPSMFRSEGKRKMMAQLEYIADVAHLSPVIVVDESHLLSYEMLEEVRFLLNSDMDSRNPMALVIVGQSELKTRLSLERYEPIVQRIDFRYQMLPYDREETALYIQSRLHYAGVEETVFDESAVNAIFAYSGGKARKISKVGEITLICAAQQSKKTIDGILVERVIQQELSW
jgi:type II secretory pathway predicted ATPase ExeA